MRRRSDTEFAGHFHHDREERVLFRALVAEAELPADRGPVHALAREHAEMEEWLREMTPLLGRRPQSVDDRAGLEAERWTELEWEEFHSRDASD